jgi:hypothetical protein
MGKNNNHRRIGDLIEVGKFHEEVTMDALKREDIIDNDIIVFDVSAEIKISKSKYPDTPNMLIHMIFADDETEIKYNAWVSGEVVIDQLKKLVHEKFLPSKDGIVMKLVKKDNKYFMFE